MQHARRLWRWYLAQRRIIQIVLGLIALSFVVGTCGSLASSPSTTNSTTASTAGARQTTTTEPNPKSKPKPKPLSLRNARLTSKTNGIVGIGDPNLGYDASFVNKASAVVSGVATCGWLGNDVSVKITFINHLHGLMRPSVDFYPSYQIAGSWHGDSFGADKSVVLKLGKYTVVDTDAGQPTGVSKGAAISNCNPRVLSIVDQYGSIHQ